VRPTNRRNSFPERDFVGVDDAQIRNPEVSHGASGGADVQRIARGDEDDSNFRGDKTIFTRGSSVESKLCVAVRSAFRASVSLNARFRHAKL
jgi:hypothetical protein